MTEAIKLPPSAAETSALSSLILKGTSTSTTDRDAGFCSGEDDLEVEDDLHSPTDVSEDSVEVKVTPISLRNKNKRKCAEPRKVPSDELPSGPLKKRIRFDPKQEAEDTGGQSPFRPWSVPNKAPQVTQIAPIPYHPVYGYQTPTTNQEEPLSLVKEHRVSQDDSNRVPPHPGVRLPTASESEDLVRMPKSSPGFTVESLLSNPPKDKASPGPSMSSHQKEQRNYKNMTRERRIEANARERTRVHTISAAFDTLRRSIPAYSHNQKLSKLSVLRIACSYILTLSRVAGKDYSADQSAPSLAHCVDLVSRTIQTEGKLRKKKDE